MGDIKFQVFGSHDSVDIDVIVFVDTMPPIEICKSLCVKYKETITKAYEKNGITLNRDVDVNLGLLDNGTLIKVFKGSSDEVNNSLYYTYNYHKELQLYPQQISSPVKRDVYLKMLRSSRIILSLLSRTKYRNEVKMALKSDFITQIDILKKIDLSTIIDFGYKNGSKEDIHKRLVFQMGQTIALSGGFDLYSKSSITGMFPSISKLMHRCEITKYDLVALEELKNRYTHKMSEHFYIIGKENEKSYFLEKNIA